MTNRISIVQECDATMLKRELMLVTKKKKLKLKKLKAKYRTVRFQEIVNPKS